MESEESFIAHLLGLGWVGGVGDGGDGGDGGDVGDVGDGGVKENDGMVMPFLFCKMGGLIKLLITILSQHNLKLSQLFISEYYHTLKNCSSGSNMLYSQLHVRLVKGINPTEKN